MTFYLSYYLIWLTYSCTGNKWQILISVYLGEDSSNKNLKEQFMRHITFDKTLDKELTKQKTKEILKEIGELQYKMYAESKHSLLIILQGLDASGKDGLTRDLLDYCNPVGLMSFSPGMSSAVSTRCTPGAAQTAARSLAVMRPWATSDRPR